MVGAILTQNTSWANVERAIANLKRAKALSPKKLLEIDLEKLEQLVRPSGYFRQKAKRLKIYLQFFFAPPILGSIPNMQKIETGEMREMLLAVNGIGPETADSILLYALDKPVFVVDAYTRRIFSRLGLVPEKIGYEELRMFFEKSLPVSVALYNDYHAQLVALGNRYCKKRPLCRECPLFSLDRCGAPDG
jgi:endonuclease-3 related protein